MRIRSTLVLPLLLALHAPSAAGQTVRGVLVDHGSGEPVPAARILLLDAEGEMLGVTLTRAAGDFTVAAGRPGVKSLRAELSGYQGSFIELSARAGADVIDLGTVPIVSVAQLIAAECTVDERRAGTSVLVGAMRDAETGTALPGATVTLVWRDGRLQTQADRTGRYRFCAVPNDSALTVEAHTALWRMPPVPLQIRGGVTTEHNFDVVLPPGIAPPIDRRLARRDTLVTLRGRVLDAQSSEPIAGARVRLRGSGQEVLTDGSGRFAFGKLPPVVYTYEVHHQTYGTPVGQVDLGEPGSEELEVLLAYRPVEIEGVTASVSSRSAAVQRSVTGTRRAVSELELVELGNRGARVADVIRERLMGLNVREGAFSTRENPNQLQNILCIESSRGVTQLTAPPGIPPFCNMVTVIMDGIRLSEPGTMLRGMPLHDLAGIEFLSSLEAGVRYGLDTDHGVLLLYTGRGIGVQR